MTFAVVEGRGNKQFDIKIKNLAKSTKRGIRQGFFKFRTGKV